MILSAMALLGLLLIAAASIATEGALEPRDRKALKSLQQAVDPGGSALSSWNSTPDPCGWRGITCKPVGRDAHRVSKLVLPRIGLSGSIPDRILGSLDELIDLTLTENRLTGTLPADVSKLRKLQKLDLRGNAFSGPIPWKFWSLSKLTDLDLSFNRLNGSIPKSIGRVRLRVVSLQNNAFSGTIPPFEVFRPEQFNVSDNRLEGNIPSSLSRLPATAFRGNLGLCGRPLAPCETTSPVAAPTATFAAPTPSDASPAPSPTTTTTGSATKASSKGKLGLILGLVIGDIVVLALLTVLFILCYRHRLRHRLRYTSSGATGDFALPPEEDLLSPEAPAGKLLFVRDAESNFKLQDLLRASAEIVSQGSLGTSYRAVLEDGQDVTVKRLKGLLRLESNEFEQKFFALGSLNHPNVLSPRACYYSKTEKLLVMDTAPRRSLAFHLHENHPAAEALDWSTRLRIVLAAAKGLAFLHCVPPDFVHGNVKSSNVLLWPGFQAKVADYGLSQLLPPEAFILASLTGYMAPEIPSTRKLTQQTDVYAFGVLVLEVLTGRAPWKFNSHGQRVDLPLWVQSVVREEWTVEVFDPKMLRFSEEEMVQLLQVALACVAAAPSQRPTMMQVVKMVADIRRYWGPSDDEAMDHDDGELRLDIGDDQA